MAEYSKGKIAKNTLYLYIRLLIYMGVTLLSSRVILQTLGVSDFGVYNIVGGFVLLFTFLQNSITNAIQRYQNIALGTGDMEYQKEVLSAGFKVIGGICGVLVLFLETGGLWFVNHRLNIPEQSMFAANVVYQTSILALVVNMFRGVDDSTIRSYEKMVFYAYVTVVEAVLKLLIIFLLLLAPSHQLVLYGVLILCVAVVMFIVFRVYVHKNLKVYYFGTPTRRATIKELLSFSGWNVFGGVSEIGFQQGSNIILNIFYGVAYNATMGITNQVRVAVLTFVRNTLIASTPQMYQLHAAGRMDEFRDLIFSISKFSFYLFMIIGVALIINMDFILSLWLTTIPPMCGLFCVLVMFICMIDAVTNPLHIGALACGKIKWYQLINGMILLLYLPGMYLAFKHGMSPQYLLIFQIVAIIVGLIYRIYFMHMHKLIKISDYFVNIIYPFARVCVLVVGIVYGIDRLLPYSGSFKLFINTPIIIVGVFIIIYFAGLTDKEKQTVTEKADKMLRKIFNKKI